MPPNAHVSGEYLRLGESLKNNCKWASQPPLAKCRPSSWSRSILCPVVPCLHHYPVYLLELARSTKLRDIPFVKTGKSVCMNTNIYIVANCRCFVASRVLLSCLQAKRQGSGNQPTASIIHLVLNGLFWNCQEIGSDNADLYFKTPATSNWRLGKTSNWTESDSYFMKWWRLILYLTVP